MASKLPREPKADLLALEADLAEMRSVIAASKRLRAEVRAPGRWPDSRRQSRAPRVARMLNRVLEQLSRVRTWRGRIYHIRWEHCSDAFVPLDDLGKELRIEREGLRGLAVFSSADDGAVV